MIERVRFQADADLHGAIVYGLFRVQPEIDIRTADQSGLRGLPDDQVLQRCAEQGRVLVTHDASTMPVHFAAFLDSGKHSPGVILIRQQVPISQAIEALHLVWEASHPDEWLDLLTYLP